MNFLTKDMIERSLWTGAEALAGLAITYLGSIPAWWAAPIALGIAAIKVNVLDRMAQAKSTKEAPAA